MLKIPVPEFLPMPCRSPTASPGYSRSGGDVTSLPPWVLIPHKSRSLLCARASTPFFPSLPSLPPSIPLFPLRFLLVVVDGLFVSKQKKEKSLFVYVCMCACLPVSVQGEEKCQHSKERYLIFFRPFSVDKINSFVAVITSHPPFTLTNNRLNILPPLSKSAPNSHLPSIKIRA